jgi:hypothetical protein
VNVGTQSINFVEVDYSKIASCLQHAQGLVSKAKALSFSKKINILD